MSDAWPRRRVGPYAVAGILFLIGVVISLILGEIGGEGLRSGAAAVGAGTAQSLPSRIVSFGPNTTEVLFALGAGDRVVGVSEFCTYPPEAQTRPRLGGLLDPNLEQLLALRPDLVVAQSRNDRLEETCRERGIPYLRVEMNDLDSIDEGIRRIGMAIGAEVEAAALPSQIREGLLELARKVQGRPRPRVFISFGRTPGTMTGLTTVSRGSFIHQLVEIAGGRNIFADAPAPYPQISKESLIRRKPEVIIELRPNERPSAERWAQLRADWQRLAMLPAVRSGRIHIQNEDFLVIPGPRVVRAANLIAQRLHPEVFDE
jgi:iron complex transport system substrate-binding protein